MDVEHVILRTLAFFDLFDHPLTRYELLSWGDTAGQYFEFSALMGALHALKERGIVAEQDGFLFLADRPELPQYRRARQEWIARKMKRITRAARLLRWVPFVEMVAVCNRLSVGHPHEESDLDVFIVIRNGRLWLSRLLVTALLQVFGLRRHNRVIADQVCLSFYVTSGAMALDAIKLGGDDVYLRYWIAQLLPLWAHKDVLSAWWRANTWAHYSLREMPMPVPFLKPRVLLSTFFVQWVLSGVLGDWLEKQARVWQRKRIETKMVPHETSTAVVISDTMLKFHEQDRRAWYAAAWRERLAEVA